MLSRTLKRLRKNCGFSQQQVADSLKIDRSTYAYYEIGKTRPDVNTIIKLSKIFNVPYTEIFEEEETNEYVLNDYDYDLDFYNKKSDAFNITEKVYELPKDEKSLICFYRGMTSEEQSDLWKYLFKRNENNKENDEEEKE